jgi:hypothetical protein
MCRFCVCVAWILFVVAVVCAQNTNEAFNAAILAGRSSAPAVVDGTGEDARFQSITSMWGNGVSLYVADATTVRRIELATARVTTVSRTASTGLRRLLGNTGFRYDYAGLYGLWSDGVALYGTDISAGTIRKIDLTTGGVQTVASELDFAWGLSGNETTLYAAMAASGTVMQVDAVTGMKSPFASTGYGTPFDCHLGSGCIGYFPPGPRSMWGDGQSLYITGYSGTVKKLDIASGQQAFLPLVPFNIGPITGAAGLVSTCENRQSPGKRDRLSRGKLRLLPTLRSLSRSMPVTGHWNDGCRPHGMRDAARNYIPRNSEEATIR